MELLLNLALIANKTNNKEIRKEINRVLDYIDRTGHVITTEVQDDKVLVYDVTRKEFILAIDTKAVNEEVSE